MKPQPDRDCIHVMRRIMEDLDDWGKWCVLCFATWLLIKQKTRRAWRRIMWGQWADWIRWPRVKLAKRILGCGRFCFSSARGLETGL